MNEADLNLGFQNKILNGDQAATQAFDDSLGVHDQTNDQQNTLTAKQQYMGSGLEEQGIKFDDYDMPALVSEGNALTKQDDSVRLGNKFVSPMKLEVAGKDLATGQRYRSPLADKEGYADLGMGYLKDSYMDSGGGTPAEDVYPLGNIALQSLMEGKSLNDFMGIIPSQWNDEQKKSSYALAQRVDNRIQLEKTFTNINSKDSRLYKEPANSEAPKYKVEDLPKAAEWNQAAKIIIQDLYGEDTTGMSEQDLTDYMLENLSLFNNNISYQAMTTTRIVGSGSDEVKQAYYNLLTLYDNIDYDIFSKQGAEFFGKALGGMAIDPANYVGAGLGIKSANALSKVVGLNASSHIVKKMLVAGLATAPEGALYGGLDNWNRQTVAIEAGAQDEINKGELGTASAIGAGATFMLGGAVEGAVTAASRNPQLMSRMKEMASNAWPTGSTSGFSGSGSPASQRGSVGVRTWGDVADEASDNTIKLGKWHSRLDTAVDKLGLPKKATGEKYKAMLDKWSQDPSKTGVTRDELKWTGLDDFLKDNASNDITKQDILDHLKYNKIDIKEETFLPSDEPEGIDLSRVDREENIDMDEDYIWSNAGDMEGDIELDEDTGLYEHWGEVSEEGQSLEDFSYELAKEQYLDSPFYAYEDPDTGYRVHGSDDIGWAAYDSYGNNISDRGEHYDLPSLQEAVNAHAREEGDLSYGEEGAAHWQEHMYEGGENYREDIIRFDPENLSDKYASRPYDENPHYDNEENILSHSLLQDFDTGSGNKTVFIDELQSDWHQSGSKEGYEEIDEKTIEALKAQADIAIKGSKAELASLMERDGKNIQELLMAEHSNVVVNPETGEYSPVKARDLITYFVDDYNESSKALSKEGKEVAEYILDTPEGEKYTKLKKEFNSLRKPLDSTIPNAPWKKNWHELTFRKLLYDAVLNGKDSISWNKSENISARWRDEYEVFYKRLYDKGLKKYANKLGKKFGSSVQETYIETNDGAKNVWELKITPQMRESLKREGIELMELGTGAGALMLMNEQSESEENGN